MNPHFVIIGFLGLFAKVDDPETSGVIQIVSALHPHSRVSSTIIVPHKGDAEEETLTWLSNYGADAHIIMIGHSYGADRALRVSRIWKTMNPDNPARMVVTVDAVHKNWFIFPTPCKEKACSLIHYNYYQNRGWITRGKEIPTATRNKLMVGSTHRSIDNDVVDEVIQLVNDMVMIDG